MAGNPGVSGAGGWWVGCGRPVLLAALIVSAGLLLGASSPAALQGARDFALDVFGPAPSVPPLPTAQLPDPPREWTWESPRIGFEHMHRTRGREQP